MSTAFDIVPVPAEAEGLDVPFDPATQGGSGKKFSCDEGTYNGIVTKLAKFQKDPTKPPRLQFEVTLTDEAVKGIRASRFYDLVGDFVWATALMAKAFGVEPINGTLPLKEKYHSIVAQPCRVKVAPREFNGKTFMDVKEVFPALAKEDAPF